MSILANSPINKKLLERELITDQEWFRRRLRRYFLKLEIGYYDTFCIENNVILFIKNGKTNMRKNGVFISYKEILQEEIQKYLLKR